MEISVEVYPCGEQGREKIFFASVREIPIGIFFHRGNGDGKLFPDEEFPLPSLTRSCLRFNRDRRLSSLVDVYSADTILSTVRVRLYLYSTLFCRLLSSAL